MSSSKLLFNQKILTICFMILFVSCGSFNTSSFVSSDGLYSDESTTKSKIQSSYYKNYFQEKINEFEKNIYTDTISLSNYVNSSNISYTNSKPSWGDIPDKKTININYHDNFYFNRYLGYGYFHDFGFDHYFWHSPYYYYNWYPYYSYRYWGSRYYPYGYWRPYTYFPYRYNWSNYYGYYPYNYNNNNQISINSGRRGSFSGSVEYNNRSSVPNNGNKNKVNYNNSRSNINLSNNMSTRYYDRIIVRKDGSSTTERSYYSKYNPGPLKNEKNEFSTSSSNYNDYDKRNNSRNSDRRYYSKEGSNWRLSGRSYNSQSTTNSNSPRSYSNPNSSRSSSNSNFNSNYSSRSSSSSITVPSSRSYSGNSSSSRTSSSSGSGRGSR